MTKIGYLNLKGLSTTYEARGMWTLREQELRRTQNSWPVSSLRFISLENYAGNTATNGIFVLPATTTSTSGIRIKGGDIAILIDTPQGNSSTPPTLVIPAGWTSVYDFSGNSTTNYARASFSYKVLANSDLGASFTGMVSLTGTPWGGRKTVLFFRGSNSTGGQITTVTGGGGTGTHTTVDPAAQTIDVSALSPVVLTVGVAQTSGTANATSLTMSVVSTNTTTRQVLYSIMPTTASIANSIFDMGDTGNGNLLAGCYFQLT